MIAGLDQAAYRQWNLQWDRHDSTITTSGREEGATSGDTTDYTDESATVDYREPDPAPRGRNCSGLSGGAIPGDYTTPALILPALAAPAGSVWSDDYSTTSAIGGSDVV
eukprot:8312106-Lingulodinium_polyedra.AAC.1